MRGAVSYEEMMRRCFAERQLIGEFLSERLTTESNKEFQVY
jgi:hypothetical protein